MTTNDYLARRDYTWLKPAYEFLGVTVGYLQEILNESSSYSMSRAERKIMYTADIVYGSSQEFIFDHLRDTNADELKEQVQGNYYFAIIDEVDHILLDEAQTPHILSGSAPNLQKEDTELVYLINSLIVKMYQDPSLINLNGARNFTNHRTTNSSEERRSWKLISFI
jgi:preprotein translocase subunit SecA